MENPSLYKKFGGQFWNPKNLMELLQKHFWSSIRLLQKFFFFFNHYSELLQVLEPVLPFNELKTEGKK